MPRRSENINIQTGFVWIPREESISSDITISGVSVKYDYIKAEFTRAVCPEIGSFTIDLINADGKFSNAYVGGEIVRLFVDLVDGTTKRFEGVVDTVKNKFEEYGEVIELAGGHVSEALLDITVTKEYNGEKSCDTILKELVDTYLTGYTYANVSASSISPTIKWSNKPFWSCVEDLCRVAKENGRFDAYVDDAKDIHFFEEESIENNNEAIVWNDTLLDLSGFGEQSTIAKNKIIVYGDDGTGLPIVRISEDSTTVYNTKEEIIKDTDINTGDQAEQLAQATLTDKKTPPREGTANCFMLPSLQPGDKIWIASPTMKVAEQARVSKYIHKYPNEFTEVVLNRRSIKQLAVPSLGGVFLSVKVA